VEDLFRIFRATTTRRRVERVDRFAIVSGDQAARFVDRACREWVFRSESAIHLRARGGQNVETLRHELSAIPERVCASSDRLRLQRLDRRITTGRKLVSDHTAHVVFKSKLINNRQIAAQVCEHFNASTIRFVIETHRRILLVVGSKANWRTRTEYSSRCR